MPTLDQIIELTETVEQHVERGEWTEARALDAERCRLLEELFADPGSAVELAAYREVLQQLLARNRQTIQRIEGRKRDLAGAAAAIDRATGAVRAYHRNRGPDNLIYLRDTRGASDEPE